MRGVFQNSEWDTMTHKYALCLKYREEQFPMYWVTVAGRWGFPLHLPGGNVIQFSEEFEFITEGTLIEIL